MEAKKCEIHGSTLIVKEVGVSYGFPLPDEELAEARRKLLPNSKRNVLGRCVAGAMGKGVETLICNECRNAEVEWIKDSRPAKYRRMKYPGLSDFKEEFSLN